MAQIELSSLQQAILDLLAGSALQPHILNVAVDLPPDGDVDDVIRITITLDDPDKVSRIEAAALIEKIEEQLSEQAGRFPSVHFAEAA